MLFIEYSSPAWSSQSSLHLYGKLLSRLCKVNWYGSWGFSECASQKVFVRVYSILSKAFQKTRQMKIRRFNFLSLSMMYLKMKIFLGFLLLYRRNLRMKISLKSRVYYTMNNFTCLWYGMNQHDYFFETFLCDSIKREYDGSPFPYFSHDLLQVDFKIPTATSPIAEKTSNCIASTLTALWRLRSWLTASLFGLMII